MSANPQLERWPVAIAGGGFSGTMLAAQLARRGVRSLLCDGSGRLARGVAYATREAAHLLNVPAGKMSAWADVPGHFTEWLVEEGLGEAASFAKRRDFGRYLGAQLDQAKGVGTAGCDIVSAKRAASGWRLVLADGREVEAEQLVLAHGNQSPAPFGGSETLPAHVFVNNPWSTDASAAVERVGESDRAVLILGTGLTMIDTMLSLAAAGHRGDVIALSRRGLVPRAHGPTRPRGVAAEQVPFGNVRAVSRWLRHQAADGDWRAAVDQLRPHSQALWRSWDTVQQRRFLRHARPYWDVHRHRIAPQIAGQLEGLRDTGRLEILAGRLRSMVPDENGLAVKLAPRSGGRERALRVAAVFNCTGPLGAIGRTSDPLLQDMLTAGAVAEDALGLGLAVDEQSRAAPGLWALGPLTKGVFWEIVAVPDIRGQCNAVADSLLEEMRTA